MKEVNGENAEEEKQLYLREHILNKGYDANEFMDYFKDSTGTADLNLNDYTMDEIKEVVNGFYAKKNPKQNDKDALPRIPTELRSESEQDNNTFLKEEEYFKDNKIKYLEIIPLTIIILLLIILNIKRCIIDLMHKKFYPYHSKRKNNFIFGLMIFSFVINVFGYIIFLFILYSMYFKKIDVNK